MIQLKSAKEIERMKAPAAINAEVLAIVRENVLEGVSTYDLDKISLEETEKARWEDDVQGIPRVSGLIVYVDQS